MKNYIPYSLLAAFAACGLAYGETAYTAPVGYVSQACLNASDTVVGTPLRLPTVAAAGLTATPDSNILTVAGASFEAFASTHYVKFTSGSDVGKIFAITSNDATTITVALNGDVLSAASGDTISVAKFWTLGELLDPALSTNDPLTTGNAIVSSSGATAGTRRTEVLLPSGGAGINLAAESNFYVNAGFWKKQGSGATNFNSQQVWPDSYFLIRHPAAVTSPTTYVIVGEVDMGANVIPLATLDGAGLAKQDNAVSLARPVDVTLNGLGLGGTAAFVSSTGGTAGTRRDEVLVFDNAVAGLNKAPVANYYFRDGIWNKQGSGTTNVGSDVIPAGAGILIRKYGTTGGVTSFWLNPASY